MSEDPRLRALFPNTPPAAAATALVDAEGHRRGDRDRVSGAFHALALTQGSLLKEEYDLSTHGHAQGWVMGAVVADLRELTVVNMKHGFEEGDRFLRETAAQLQSVSPKAKVVRIHSDAFALLLGPIAEDPVTPQHRAKALAALKHPCTVGLLQLTVVAPSHWQVLGPLVWAECERTLVLARRAPGHDGVVTRRIVLDGGLPEEALSGR